MTKYAKVVIVVKCNRIHTCAIIHHGHVVRHIVMWRMVARGPWWPGGGTGAGHGKRRKDVKVFLGERLRVRPGRVVAVSE